MTFEFGTFTNPHSLNNSKSDIRNWTGTESSNARISSGAARWRVGVEILN
jgi:hypothetical protein